MAATAHLTLEEIRTLLRFKDDPQADCAEVNALLDAHIGHVATRVRGLTTSACRVLSP